MGDMGKIEFCAALKFLAIAKLFRKILPCSKQNFPPSHLISYRRVSLRIPLLHIQHWPKWLLYIASFINLRVIIKLLFAMLQQPLFLLIFELNTISTRTELYKDW